MNIGLQTLDQFRVALSKCISEVTCESGELLRSGRATGWHSRAHLKIFELGFGVSEFRQANPAAAQCVISRFQHDRAIHVANDAVRLDAHLDHIPVTRLVVSCLKLFEDRPRKYIGTIEAR